MVRRGRGSEACDAPNSILLARGPGADPGCQCLFEKPPSSSSESPPPAVVTPILFRPAAGAEWARREVTEFVDPILLSTDPSYDLRGGGSTAQLGTGIRIALKCWKIVSWVESGTLMHRASS